MTEHFFITGGTGLLGRYLIARVLRSFPGSSATLLVRPVQNATAQERVSVLEDDLRRRGELSEGRGRVTAVAGDVSLPDLGLRGAERDAIIERTTTIIHGAATIRFDHTLADARAVNLDGTQRALALALECDRRSRLRRFVYIGTSSVSGNRAGLIREDERETGQSYFNTYEQSKCEAERLVQNHAGTLPTTIFRPSIMIGDSRTGYTSLFNVVYIPLRLIHRGILEKIPAHPSTLLDLVPVDWVTDAMTAILVRPDSAGGVYHLTAGPERAEPLGSLIRLACDFFDRRAPLAWQRSVQCVSEEEFQTHRRELTGRAAALGRQLDVLMPYISVNRLFDSTNADRILAGTGVQFPRFPQYAEKIFDYCLRSNWGKITPD